jgi:hypothetical protein
MNATERDQLQQFLGALRQTRADPKDPVADALIREAVALQADAPYLLVQRAMGLGLALDAALARIQQLEAQCAEQAARLLSASTVAPATSSFLMSGAQAWGRGTEAAAVSSPAPVSPPVAVQSRVMVSGAAPQASAWGGGLMAQVATTAAGVVAGGLLFQGVQSLMGHHGPSTSPASPLSPLSSATEEALPGQVSSQVPPADVADAGDAGDVSWGDAEDWA